MSSNRERRQTRSLTATTTPTPTQNSASNTDTQTNSKRKLTTKEDSSTQLTIEPQPISTDNSQALTQPDSKIQTQTRTSLRRSNSSLNKLAGVNSSILSNKTQNSIVNRQLTEKPAKSENLTNGNKKCIKNKIEIENSNINVNINNFELSVNTHVKTEPAPSSSSSSTASSSSSSHSSTKLQLNTSSLTNHIETLNLAPSQKISTRRRSSYLLNQLRVSNSLSSPSSNSSSCLIEQSSASSLALSRKRNLSSSTDLTKTENQINIENLNNDSCSHGHTSSPASSSSAASTLPIFQNKRLKLKHKYAFKELSINEDNSNIQTSFRLLSKDEFDNSSLNENRDDLDEDANEEEDLKETLNCPVKGCNSAGHLDGSGEHHFTYDTCPLYFHMSGDECTKRKSDLDKRLNDLKEKIARFNENKKNLRNKQTCKEQSGYYEKVSKELKQLVKEPDSSTQKKSKLNFLSDNPDLLGDIKNLSTSFIINSISHCLTPTPMPIHHHSLIKHSNNATNFLNNLNHTKAQAPQINDLAVSKFELDLFKDVLITSTKEIIPQLKDTSLKKLKLVNKTNKIIQFGNYEIETWYKSPYPDDIWQLNKIFICQYCLIYMRSHSVLNRHLEKCLWRHPPGREIYRKDSLSFFEVDGKFNKIYCQNLCLLAKLFLDHKTLYYDVEPFLFYVLTQYSEETGSFQMIGYFSKEKQSIMNYNLSCILILPQFMNKGFGKVLIDFSYLLSRAEGKIGSPERPLSDLGLISYRSYWKTKLMVYLAKHMDETEISVKEISAETGILTNDLISTLQYIGLIKYWKGKHVILKDKELFDKYLERKYSTSLDVEPTCLKWAPYVYQTIINEPDAPVHHAYVKGNKHNYSTT